MRSAETATARTAFRAALQDLAGALHVDSPALVWGDAKPGPAQSHTMLAWSTIACAHCGTEPARVRAGHVFGRAQAWQRAAAASRARLTHPDTR